VGRNPYGCSKFGLLLPQPVRSTLMIRFVMCETVECAHIVNVFLFNFAELVEI
jgi:hypothetical protein